MARKRIYLGGELADYRQSIQVLTDPSVSAHGLHFINASPTVEKNPLSGDPRVFCRKRPGVISLYAETAFARKFGKILFWVGLSDRYTGTNYWVYSTISGSNAIVKYSNSDGAPATMGSIATSSINGSWFSMLSETDVSGTKTILAATANGGYAYYGENTPSSLTAISDAQYPANDGQTTCGKFVPLDGYVFIMTQTGRVYNSDINSVTAWTSGNFITAGDYPDIGRGLARYGTTIAAFGTKSIEFFRNSGNPTGSPLQRIQEYAVSGIGAIHAQSILQFDDNVYWLAEDSNLRISLYKFVNFKPVKLSTLPVERKFPSSSTGGWSVGIETTIFPMNVWGHKHICIPLDTTTTTPPFMMLMYNLELGIWWEWTTSTSSTAAIIDGSGGRFITLKASDNTSGAISRLTDLAYLSSTEAQDDRGTQFTMRVVTSDHDFGNQKRKFLDRAFVVGDSALSSDATGDPSDPTITLRTNNDDYTTASWSAARTMTLNQYLTRLGPFRRMAFDIENTDTNHVRLEWLELEYREGTH